LHQLRSCDAENGASRWVRLLLVLLLSGCLALPTCSQMYGHCTQMRVSRKRHPHMSRT
jgi:hypothetical protein